MSFEQMPKQESPNRSKELETLLLAGKLSKEDFLAQIDALDQSTPTHAASISNAAVLERAEVKALFEQDPDYENTRSLAHFHVGQIRAMQARYEEALAAFERSLLAAQTITEDDYQDWVEYVRGTVAYFKKDIATLKSIDESGKAISPDVIQRLHTGLSERGTIDYRKDYGE